MQTLLLASAAKCFAMKKIGEQAQEFRLSKGWNSTRMAKEVGTSRQNIESLEENPGRIPKYLAKLAGVMGLTVDDLIQGKYSAGQVISTDYPGDLPESYEAENKDVELSELIGKDRKVGSYVGTRTIAAVTDKEVIRRLANKLNSASEGMQKAILALLGEYAKNPKDDRLNSQIAELLNMGGDDSTV